MKDPGVYTYRQQILCMILLSAFLVLLTGIQAQDTTLLKTRVSVSFNEVPLSEALTRLSEQADASIVFSPDFEDMDMRVRYQREATLGEILDDLLLSTRLQYQEHQGHVLLSRDISRYTVSGYAIDAKSGERLIGAHIFDLKSGKGTITNRYGYYSLTLPSDSVRLAASYLGYTTGQRDMLLKQNQLLDFPLENSARIDEVVITRPGLDSEYFLPLLPDQPVTDKMMEDMVSLGGEPDLNKFLATKPGITSGADGIGGLCIRGGSSDQNLVLMDGVPVYNPSHAIGLFSVFNPKMIRDVDVRKSHFPSSYGGRLSSVIDVHTKEGNLREWSLAGSISPTSVNLLVEGPVKKEEGSLLVSVRRFLPDFLLEEISRRQKADDGLSGSTNFVFYDINVKWQSILTEKDKFYLSFYRGEDRYTDNTTERYQDEISIEREEFNKSLNWGNSIGIFRWNHTLHPRLFVNTTATFSRFGLRSFDHRDYRFTLLGSNLIDTYDTREFKSEIIDLGIKVDVDHPTSGNHLIQFGAAATRHEFRPKSISTNEDSQIGGISIPDGTIPDDLLSGLFIQAMEMSGYFNGKFRFRPDWYLEGGLRLGAFLVQGESYFYPEPRLHLRYAVNSEMAIYVNANRMVQPLHLLTSSGIGLPTDLWVPATSRIKPQEAFQVSTGLDFLRDLWVIRFSAFWKKLDHLIQYQEGASFLLEGGTLQASLIDAANWENKITTGDGEAYGAEIEVALGLDRFQARFNYSYSHSTRHFEQINFGKSFPFRFDRRHSLNILSSFTLSDQLSLYADWNYGSGLPITLAISKYLHQPSYLGFGSVVALEYSERNAERLPDYHRLNLGLEWRIEKQHAVHQFNIDLYNVYDRENPFYYTLIENEREQTFENKQFTVVGFLPSLSYTLNL